MSLDSKGQSPANQSVDSAITSLPSLSNDFTDCLDRFKRQPTVQQIPELLICVKPYPALLRPLAALVRQELPGDQDAENLLVEQGAGVTRRHEESERLTLAIRPGKLSHDEFIAAAALLDYLSSPDSDALTQEAGGQPTFDRLAVLLRRAPRDARAQQLLRRWTFNMFGGRKKAEAELVAKQKWLDTALAEALGERRPSYLLRLANNSVEAVRRADAAVGWSAGVLVLGLATVALIVWANPGNSAAGSVDRVAIEEIVKNSRPAAPIVDRRFIESALTAVEKLTTGPAKPAQIVVLPNEYSDALFEILTVKTGAETRILRSTYLERIGVVRTPRRHDWVGPHLPQIAGNEEKSTLLAQIRGEGANVIFEIVEPSTGRVLVFLLGELATSGLGPSECAPKSSDYVARAVAAQASQTQQVDIYLALAESAAVTDLECANAAKLAAQILDGRSKDGGAEKRRDAEYHEQRSRAR